MAFMLRKQIFPGKQKKVGLALIKTRRGNKSQIIDQVFHKFLLSSRLDDGFSLELLCSQKYLAESIPSFEDILNTFTTLDSRQETQRQV